MNAQTNHADPKSPLRTVTFDVGGMTCAACASRIETVVGRLPGITSVSVNLPLERADVVMTPDVADEAVIDAVDLAGYSANPRRGTASERRLAEEERAAERRAKDRQTLVLFIGSALLTLPLMLPMLLKPFGFPWHPAPWTEFALAAPVQFIAGWRFYRGAWKAIRTGGATMDVLVALGTSAAFFFSLYMILRHGEHAHGHLYFEGAAAVITLVLFGKVLETRARRGTTEAVRALIALRPQTARLRRHGATADAPIEEVRSGDLVEIRPGERFPVDGTITEGETEADESLITGESVPVAKHVGDGVVTGALNGGGLVVIAATAIGEDTTLARITRMVEAAQTGKAPVQRLVDRISAVFVPVIIAIAAIAFAGWLIAGHDVETALIAAVSVLVIACPCALGLATPAALVAGTGAAARAGILVKDIEALERVAQVDVVVLDKTGTLTLGKPVVAEVVPAEGFTRASLLALAGTVQGPSEHPLGKAIRAAAVTDGAVLGDVEGFRAVVGEGVEGKVDGRAVIAGKPAYLVSRGVDFGPLAKIAAQLGLGGATVTAVAADGKLAGLIALADAVHPQARAAIDALRARDIRVMMVTGDAEGPALRVAAELGLSSGEVRFGVRPEGKVAVVRELVASGARAAMVGDGINDAPALAAAHVGIAMGGGTDAAIETASVALMRSNPILVPGAIDIARKTVAKIRQNLFWAFVYNVVGVPLAAFGLLSPAIAGAAMAMSSVSVVVNSLTLRNWKP